MNILDDSTQSVYCDSSDVYSKRFGLSLTQDLLGGLLSDSSCRISSSLILIHSLSLDMQSDSSLFLSSTA